ncbi:MAG TPA: superoxide dismutase family protein [Acidimicrobiales bacterium]|nr:superoxide dismutase family protein [Acidimicrobiales bacterium]
MRRSHAVIVLALAVLVAGCGEDATDPAASSEQSREGAIEVTMANADGDDVGTVTLVPEEGKIRVEAELEGLEPGFHGFHVHDTGRCEPEAPEGAFTTAKGHLAGGGNVHGEHAGDMPSLYVTEDGRASLNVLLDRFAPRELLADDGAAIMVHGDPDNFAHVPDRYTSSEAEEPGPDEDTRKTGDAGARVACGVIGTGT